MERSRDARVEAVRTGAARPQLMHPVIDLSRCLGCGTCVAACPEEQVLELVHGQASVVHGARCEGIAACERECPVDAIQVTLAEAGSRSDVPALEGLEAVETPGLFLAGEVTAKALIKNAIEQGAAVAAEVAERPRPSDRLDLCIVGAGPAGLACALEAKRRGLNYVLLEQEDHVGGTIARYPRRKVVLTQPATLPLVGRLDRSSYSKEELVGLWDRIAIEQQLEVRTGEPLLEIARSAGDAWTLWTPAGSYVASHVCLAVGRRGTPKRLGIPGEELPKVTYHLEDAREVSGRRVLVVGGGDSAVEAALALAPRNEVTLAYRGADFYRLRGPNARGLEEARLQGDLRVLTETHLREVHAGHVGLEPHGLLPNDDVLISIGGQPNQPLLERAGVSFDPAARPPVRPQVEEGTGLVRALTAAFALALMALLWTTVMREYYALSDVERPTHRLHEWLRPGRGLGLALGIGAAGLIAVNLLYLVRRAPRTRLRFGSLRTWMTVHVVTGVLAVLFALVHGAMAPGAGIGGQAFWALAILMATGAVGRYLYAWVPRAANGRELELEEVRAQLRALETETEETTGFAKVATDEVEELVQRRQWRRGPLGTIAGMLFSRRDLRRTLASLEARASNVDQESRDAALLLARRAHRAATSAAHVEDLRALLNTWRWLHRWAALVLVLLVAVHVYFALAYSAEMP